MDTAQKRAVRNYRSRLGERGLARFEVFGRDADRDLIRSLTQQPRGEYTRGLKSFGGGKELNRWRAPAAWRDPRRIAPFAAGGRRSRSFSLPGRRTQDRPLTRYLLDTNIISNVVKLQPFGIAPGVDVDTTRRGFVHRLAHRGGDISRNFGEAARQEARRALHVVLRP